MGNNCTQVRLIDGDGTKQNTELEEWLANEQVENMLEWKVLILGAGESGKSTVIKQLKSIYNIKPEESELNTAAAAIHYNTLYMMRILIANQREFNFDLYDPIPERNVKEPEERDRRKSEAGEMNGEEKNIVANSPRGKPEKEVPEKEKEELGLTELSSTGKKTVSLKQQALKSSMALRKDYDAKRRAERRRNRKQVHRMRRDADAASAKAKDKSKEANGESDKEGKEKGKGKGKEKKGKKDKDKKKKGKNDLEKLATMVHDYNIDDSPDNRLPYEIGAAIDALWRESGGIHKAYAKRNSFWFLDSADYYFDNVMRYVEADYRPTEEDLIMARVMTTGILETTFKDTRSPVNFKVFDVGGQRNERRKWFHCFDNVKCVLFVASLPGYDQVLMEDTRKNRMIESIELFAEIANNEIFKETPIFLFLNKKDLFESMLRVRGLETTFPDYKGDNSYMESLQYLIKRFEAVSKNPAKPVEVYDISTRVRKDVKDAWEKVKKHLVESNKKIIADAEREKRKRARRLAKEAKKNSSSASLPITNDVEAG